MAKKLDMVWFILVINNTIVFAGTNESYMYEAQTKYIKEYADKGRSITFMRSYTGKAKTKKTALMDFLKVHRWLTLAPHLVAEVELGTSNGSIGC